MKVSVVACKRGTRKVDVTLVRARSAANTSNRTIIKLPVKLTDSSAGDAAAQVSPANCLVHNATPTSPPEVYAQDIPAYTDEDNSVSAACEPSLCPDAPVAWDEPKWDIRSKADSPDVSFSDDDAEYVDDVYDDAEYDDDDELDDYSDDNTEPDDNFAKPFSPDAPHSGESMLYDEAMEALNYVEDLPEDDEDGVRKPVISMRYLHRDADGDKIEVDESGAVGKEVICVDQDSGRLSRICGYIKRNPKE